MKNNNILLSIRILVVFCLSFLLISCAYISSFKKTINSSSKILQNIEDKDIVGKTSGNLEDLKVLIANFNVAVSNFNNTAEIINSRLPEALNDLDLALTRNLTYSANILQDFDENMVVENFNGNLLSLKKSLDSFNLTISNYNNTSGILNEKLPIVLDNANETLEKIPDVLEKISVLATNISSGVHTIETILKGNDPDGGEAWWSIKFKKILNYSLVVLQAMAFILCVLFGRMIWVLGRKFSINSKSLEGDFLRHSGDKSELDEWEVFVFKKISRWLGKQ